ncbi:MAG: NAD(P)/FAD-dependent oxidoreductase, partial [Deltaproteobacteria bacterium]|nr:NAD(P)/FAD-dependent oxidoreductase [Deltaproteobacteria bacterium]
VVVVAPGHFNSVRAWQDSRIGKRPEDYKRYKEDALRRIREAVVKLCPELACVRFVDGATPLTMRDYLRTPHGSLYGAKHTVDRRNPIPLTRIPNLWLAGQSVIAPGLMGTMFSAFLACGFLLGHNTLHGEVACS